MLLNVWFILLEYILKCVIFTVAFAQELISSKFVFMDTLDSKTGHSVFNLSLISRKRAVFVLFSVKGYVEKYFDDK